jgi:predicted transcriptional regulator YdeE
MLTIGQLARIFGVSTRTLRHYDEIDLFSPAAIGEENQYRYYTNEQIPLLQRILFLRELGIGLEIMKELSRSSALHDGERLKAILTEQRDGIVQEMEKKRQLLHRIDATILQLDADPDCHAPVVQEEASRHAPRIVTMGDFQIVGLSCLLGEGDIPQLWEELNSQLQELGDIASRAAAIGLCEPTADGCTYIAGFQWAPQDEEHTPAGLVKRTVPLQKYAAFSYQGPASGIAGMFRQIYTEWLPANGLTACEGTELEVYENHEDAERPQDVKVELYVPIEEE